VPNAFTLTVLDSTAAALAAPQLRQQDKPWTKLQTAFYCWMVAYIFINVGCIINFNATMNVLFILPVFAYVWVGDVSHVIGAIGAIIVVPFVVAWFVAVFAAPFVFILGQPFWLLRTHRREQLDKHLAALSAIRKGACMAELRARGSHQPRHLRVLTKLSSYWAWWSFVGVAVLVAISALGRTVGD
jgi:hypothetical protein